jgi:tRNA dimethylallyltransferase
MNPFWISDMKPAQKKPKLIIICGPTGIGKTATAIEIAEAFNAEIIGADSMQIFRYMDIGTAKPTTAEQARIPHHMIDIVDPDAPFDAARFANLARAKAAQLHDRGIIPFMVGGTGLYIKSFLSGIFQSEPVDSKIRDRLRKEATEHGTDFLYRRLKQCDPITAKRLHPNDSYRILRALETYEATGKPISEYQNTHAFSGQPFDVLKIGLNMDRALLYERINERVDAMIAAGFVDEVKKLLNMGYPPALKSMQSIGYRLMVDYLEGRFTREECVRTLKRDHRRYAKRQLTWFGADDEIVWMEPGQVQDIKDLVVEFLKKSCD